MGILSLFLWRRVAWTPWLLLLVGYVGASSLAEEVSPAPSVVRLRNPGFEEQLEGWHRGGWHLESGTDSVSVDEAIHHGGNHSAKLVHGQPNDTYLVQSIPVTPLTVYHLSGWIKTERVVVHETGKVGAAFGVEDTWAHSDDVRGTQPWQFRELWVRTAPRQTQLRVTCRLGHWGSTATGTVWFDDVQVDRPLTLPFGVVPHDLVSHTKSSSSYWLVVGGMALIIIGLERWVRILQFDG